MNEPQAFIIFKIEDVPTDLDLLHVEMSAANTIAFDLNRKDLDYHTCIADICKVAPHMLSLDGDLQEAYDDAFRTMPKKVDQIAVAAFLQKYAGRLPEDLREMFV